MTDMTDFNWEIYLFKYPDLVEQGIRTKQDACSHYKKFGLSENRNCNVPISFDAERYIRLYKHLNLKTRNEAYLHYMKIGSFLNRFKKRNDNNFFNVEIFQQKSKENNYIFSKPKVPEQFHPVKPTKPKPHLVSHSVIPLTAENKRLSHNTLTSIPTISSRGKLVTVPEKFHPIKPTKPKPHVISHLVIPLTDENKPTSNSIVPSSLSLRRKSTLIPTQLQPSKPIQRSKPQSPTIETLNKSNVEIPLKPISLPRRKPLTLSKPTKTVQPTTNIVLPVIQPPVPVRKPVPPLNTFKPIKQSQPLRSRFGRICQPAIVKQNNLSKKPITTPLLTILKMNKHIVRQPKPGQLVLTESPSSYFGKRGLLGPPKYIN